MSTHMRIGSYTEKDLGFPCDPNVMRSIHAFSVDGQTKCVTFAHAGPGIVPAIESKVQALNAKEFVCHYPNRVAPFTRLTVLYR